ncbi:unnamed protein product [Amoebophrya sp. A25]|nr:unnamed protein product [Amoebophrya sp. A25]|eukprot:GSA25T00003301001.1
MSRREKSRSRSRAGPSAAPATSWAAGAACSACGEPLHMNNKERTMKLIEGCGHLYHVGCFQKLLEQDGAKCKACDQPLAILGDMLDVKGSFRAPRFTKLAQRERRQIKLQEKQLKVSQMKEQIKELEEEKKRLEEENAKEDTRMKQSKSDTEYLEKQISDAQKKLKEAKEQELQLLETSRVCDYFRDSRREIARNNNSNPLQVKSELAVGVGGSSSSSSSSSAGAALGGTALAIGITLFEKGEHLQPPLGEAATTTTATNSSSSSSYPQNNTTKDAAVDKFFDWCYFQDHIQFGKALLQESKRQDEDQDRFLDEEVAKSKREFEAEEEARTSKKKEADESEAKLRNQRPEVEKLRKEVEAEKRKLQIKQNPALEQHSADQGPTSGKKAPGTPVPRSGVKRTRTPSGSAGTIGARLRSQDSGSRRGGTAPGSEQQVVGSAGQAKAAMQPPSPSPNSKRVKIQGVPLFGGSSSRKNAAASSSEDKSNRKTTGGGRGSSDIKSRHLSASFRDLIMLREEDRIAPEQERKQDLSVVLEEPVGEPQEEQDVQQGNDVNNVAGTGT